jgi:hypothetical protein
MAPDTVLNTIRLVLTICFCAIAWTVFLCTPAVTSPMAQALKTPGYCMAESGGIVYFSALYDTKLNQPVRISSSYIAREFVEYLKGRYEFTPQGNDPASCGVLKNSALAEASKRQFETQARQANKQVIETDWRFVPEDEIVAASYSHIGEDVVQVVALKRKITHTYCVSEPFQGTLYTTGPIETGAAVNLSLWYRGFSQLLTQKYSFKGTVHCNIGSLPEITRILGARVGGARAAGRQVVDTRWKYDALAVASGNTTPAKRDDDPEPVQRPTPPPPSASARDLAAKEMPESVAYCKRDAALSAVFNCDRFGRVVYNYRIAHVNETREPVASLVAAHKLNCAECIDNTRVSLWVSQRANTDKLETKVTNCVTQNVIVTLYKTPEAERLMDFYKQAVAACNKP